MDIVCDETIPVQALAVAWHLHTSEPQDYNLPAVLAGFVLSTAHLWSLSELLQSSSFNHAVARLVGRLQSESAVSAVLGRVADILQTKTRQDLKHRFAYLSKLMDIVVSEECDDRNKSAVTVL